MQKLFFFYKIRYLWNIHIQKIISKSINTKQTKQINKYKKIKFHLLYI